MISINFKKYIFVALAFYSVPAHAMEQSKDLDIFEACKVGDVARVQELIRSGASVNSKDRFENVIGGESVSWDYFTPLMAAAAKGHLLLVLELIKAGANIYERSNCDHYNLSFDAFCFAVWNAHFDVAHALLQAGANIDRSVDQSTYNHLLAKFFDRPVYQKTLLEILQWPEPGCVQRVRYLVASNARIGSAILQIARMNGKSNLRGIISNSFVIPSHSNVVPSIRLIKTVLISFNRLKLPRDMRQLILLEAVPREVISVLAKRISQKKAMPIFALELMASACYQATAEMLIPELEEAHNFLPSCLSEKNAGDPSFRFADASIAPLIDPANFEKNYGEQLRANIRSRLANPYQYMNALLNIQ